MTLTVSLFVLTFNVVAIMSIVRGSMVGVAKALWVLGVVVTPVLGAVAYFAIHRRRLA